MLVTRNPDTLLCVGEGVWVFATAGFTLGEEDGTAGDGCAGDG